MSSKHTPGPWQVLPEEMGKNYLRVRGTVLGLRYKIADVRNPDYEDVTRADAELTHANARLIASAPELLEALIRLEAELVEDKYGECYEPSPFENLALARAAIAKATGGAQ